MCISMPLKVRDVIESIAIMEDGRSVRLGLLKDVQAGDYLEVYADVAMGKIQKAEALDQINALNQQGGAL